MQLHAFGQFKFLGFAARLARGFPRFPAGWSCTLAAGLNFARFAAGSSGALFVRGSATNARGFALSQRVSPARSAWSTCSARSPLLPAPVRLCGRLNVCGRSPYHSPPKRANRKSRNFLLLRSLQLYFGRFGARILRRRSEKSTPRTTWDAPVTAACCQADGKVVSCL